MWVEGWSRRKVRLIGRKCKGRKWMWITDRDSGIGWSWCVGHGRCGEYECRVDGLGVVLEVR